MGVSAPVDPLPTVIVTQAQADSLLEGESTGIWLTRPEFAMKRIDVRIVNIKRSRYPKLAGKRALDEEGSTGFLVPLREPIKESTIGKKAVKIRFDQNTNTMGIPADSLRLCRESSSNESITNTKGRVIIITGPDVNGSMQHVSQYAEVVPEAVAAIFISAVKPTQSRTTRPAFAAHRLRRRPTPDRRLMRNSTQRGGCECSLTSSCIRAMVRSMIYLPTAREAALDAVGQLVGCGGGCWTARCTRCVRTVRSDLHDSPSHQRAGTSGGRPKWRPSEGRGVRGGLGIATAKNGMNASPCADAYKKESHEDEYKEDDSDLVIHKNQLLAIEYACCTVGTCGTRTDRQLGGG
ncbi:hypothetical protein MSAN_00103300 [Mycena sanguinolenta]|uniref:Uncharacterized protein n=1 Tax=Mycena sanguinolenta TaxID=230812 RepID=A0A8H7DLM0_9AGAR|nr:hypothetical protein MSAN_00103300 [Mycena sanguinolenta]